MKNFISELKVGDRVVMRDVNENRKGGVKTGTVVKVGRTYVYVGGDHRGYSREDGYVNDAYRHAYLQTIEYHAYMNERHAAELYLKSKGLEVSLHAGVGSASVRDKLLDIVAALKPVLGE